MKNKISTVWLLIFVFCLCINTTFSQNKPNPQHKVKIGDTAPDFQLYFPNGKTQLLSDLKGKVIMLQFTASWCSVCLKEMPFIEAEIWQKLKNHPDFVLIGIDFKESPDKIPPFLKAAKTTYPMALDTNGQIFELFAEKDAGVTRNIIIEKTGKIAYLTRLFAREEFDEMKKKIEELLELK